MHHKRKWEEYPPLVEFSYNNQYQEYLKMSPFEAHFWRSIINWIDLVNKLLIRLDMLVEMEQEMKVIKMNLKETWDRKKSYANQHSVFKEFQVGEHI